MTKEEDKVDQKPKEEIIIKYNPAKTGATIYESIQLCYLKDINHG